MRKIPIVWLLALVLSSCDGFSAAFDGFRQSNEVAESLEKSSGMKPEVGFNWSNGRLLSVTVTFPRLPKAQSVEELAAATEKAVAASFKQNPEKIVFGFDLQPAPSQ
ncbi:hypothetical protein [Methylocapsa sp. S129]|uniref:hypothetical protein n=1 Tax=Methylocapsa sp. S129 TaxID=1641869 RepID=UPI00131B8A82|nr:hypothetical protein [Methylocapsa sp. S129]